MSKQEYELGTTKKVKELVLKCSDRLSLDAGCGKGVYFDSFNANVVGLDIYLPFLKGTKNVAQSKHVHLILGDVKALPFWDSVFDYVLCSEVIEHPYEDDARKTISEFKRACVHSGIIQVDKPNTNFLLKVLRKIFYGRSKDDAEFKLDENPLRHHSLWTKRKLESEGFCVKGCLGWVTRKRIKFDFIADFCDLFVWNIPAVAGTLIGIKRNAKKQ